MATPVRRAVLAILLAIAPATSAPRVEPPATSCASLTRLTIPDVSITFLWSWNARHTTDGPPILPASRLPLLHEAAVAACDGRDGRVDGVIDDPAACAFDPSVLRRVGDETDRCPTEAQVPNRFDALAALEAWVERGQAPERIIAPRMADGKTDATRPLCPYPSVSRYSGRGSADEAASYACVVPARGR